MSLSTVPGEERYCVQVAAVVGCVSLTVGGLCCCAGCHEHILQSRTAAVIRSHTMSHDTNSNHPVVLVCAPVGGRPGCWPSRPAAQQQQKRPAQQLLWLPQWQERPGAFWKPTGLASAHGLHFEAGTGVNTGGLGGEGAGLEGSGLAGAS